MPKYLAVVWHRMKFREVGFRAVDDTNAADYASRMLGGMFERVRLYEVDNNGRQEAIGAILNVNGEEIIHLHRQNIHLSADEFWANVGESTDDPA